MEVRFFLAENTLIFNPDFDPNKQTNSALNRGVVFISVSKIQFESKSQHIAWSYYDASRCLSVCQRYNLKANHN